MRKRNTMDSTVKARKAELVWTSTETSVSPPRFPDTAHYSCDRASTDTRAVNESS